MKGIENLKHLTSNILISKGNIPSDILRFIPSVLILFVSFIEIIKDLIQLEVMRNFIVKKV